MELCMSGPIKQKEWWIDMSRALGGRLRPFALAVGPADNCEFIFRGNEQGVMLACYWIDRRIAGDSPKNGVALSALTIEPTAE